MWLMGASSVMFSPDEAFMVVCMYQSHQITLLWPGKIPGGSTSVVVVVVQFILSPSREAPRISTGVTSMSLPRSYHLLMANGSGSLGNS